MPSPILPQPTPDDEPWPEIELRFPPGANPRTIIQYEFEPADALDPRLKGYHLQLALSEPTPEDPNPWPYWWCSLDPTGPPLAAWRLWLITVRYDRAPAVAIAWWEPGFGWRERLETQLGATPSVADYTKAAYGLRVFQQLVARGRPRGSLRIFETPEEFQDALARAKRLLHGPLTKTAIAQQMGISRSSLYLWLKRFPEL